MRRFIGTPFERLNAKRVSGQTLPCTGPSQRARQLYLESLAQLDEAGGTNVHAGKSANGLLELKKKNKKPQLSPAPTGTVHTEVSSCTLKNVLVRLTVTKSKV